jgi:hypothetical protein
MRLPDDAELVIRPRPGGAPDRARARFALAFVPIVLLGVIRAVRVRPAAGLWYAAGFAALAGIALLARRDFFARTSIRVDPSDVVRTGYFGRSARCPRAAVTRVVEASLVVTRLGGFPDTWLVFLDSGGKPLLRAYAEYYPSAELLRLRDTLGVEWDSLGETRTFARIRREIPRSFPWALAHVWLTLAIIAVVALFAVVAVSAAT